MARYTAFVEGVASTTSQMAVLQVTAGTQRAGVYGLRISLKGTSSTAAPVRVKLARTTTAGTSSATPTIASVDSSGVTATATAQATFSAQPTLGEILWVMEIHPQTGAAEYIPLGDEFVVPAAGRVAVSVLAGADVPVTAQLYWREGH